MIWLAFGFGLVSSLHCSLMCAPLQAVVMGQWLRNGRKNNWLIYHLGRFFTYASLGLLAATLGGLIGLSLHQKEFSILAGLALLLGYFGLKYLRWDRRLNRLITPFLMRLQARLKGGKSRRWYFLSGSLNGLLPCGMVYAALIPAAASGSILSAISSMLAFGLGTLPLLLSINLASNSLLQRFSRSLQQLIPLSVALIALVLIMRGLELDIPYLSPAHAAPAVASELCR